jgi:hypothetical protein
MVVVLNKNGEPKFGTTNSGGSTPEYDVVEITFKVIFT